jgi:broad specificity phosphatase PhoE
MSEMYFIRHGQASFGEENYDRLSPTGVRQSQVLARHLIKTGKRFDALYCGEMQRQQQTAQELISRCRGKKLNVPDPVISAAFNEYDSFSVWRELLPEVLAEDPSLSINLEKLGGDKKAFQRVFAKVMSRWVSGNYKASKIPVWHGFVRRVRQGIEELRACHGSGKLVAIFTSGGTISVAVQTALGLSDPKTLEVAWQLMNASITRFRFNSRGITLAGFNDITHLELEADPSLITFR